MSELEDKIKETLETKCSARIAVVGDVMLDEYIRCDTYGSTVCETGRHKVISVRRCPGGAGNVALGVKALGGYVKLFSSLGNDDDGSLLRAKLVHENLDYSLAQEERCTVKKTRYLSRGTNKHLFHVDREVNYPITHASTSMLLEELKRYNPTLIVVSDYDKSVVTDDLMAGISSMGVLFIVDPKNKPYSIYRDYALIKPNEASFERAVNSNVGYYDGPPITELVPLFKFNNISQALLLTRGEKGADLWVNSCTDGLKQLTGCSVRQRNEPVDTTGCGDSALAGLAVAWSWGWDLEDCARLAMATAACAVDHIGVHAATLDEVRTELQTFEY